MMQHEFEALIGERIDPTTYTEVVEVVYSRHPLITDTKGKQQMAQLWAIGGEALLRDMLPTAQAQLERERVISEKTRAISALQTERDDRISMLYAEYAEREAELRADINANAVAHDAANRQYEQARAAVRAAKK